jgi:glycosyltransferase involved in cell wall biosynthesis
VNADTVIFISGAWPGTTKGYEIANHSTLTYFAERGSNIYYFGPSESFQAARLEASPNCHWLPVNFSRKPKSIRFLRSLFSPMPAVTERFWNSESEISSKLDSKSVQPDSKTLFFYEDVPAASLLFELSMLYPESTHAVRSHNVIYKGFSGMRDQSRGIMTSFWSVELSKIRRFERQTAEQSDLFFAISDDDDRYYKEALKCETDGIISCYLDDHYFKMPEQRDTNTLLFLGGADMRKSIGLRRFLEVTWPQIRKKRPEARLILGGKNTKRFNNPSENVTGLGFVEDEFSFLSRGNIFINPQTIGAGIKIKSIVALAAGKVLVTTPTGAEGIGLKDTIHCVIEEDFNHQASQIVALLEDRAKRDKLAEAGHRYVLNNFAKSHFFSTMDSLFGTGKSNSVSNSK